MTRIIAGRWGGRRLVVPRDGVRPTSDRVREAMFNWLDHRVSDWAECRVLDLYAGSGALGLEAVSRGAGGAVLVERDRSALGSIRRNVVALAAADLVQVRPGSVERVAAEEPVPSDLVFADPPYEMSAVDLAARMAAFITGGWLRPGALVVVETAVRAGSPWPAGIIALERRPYGDTAVWYGRRHTPASGDEQD